MTKIQTLKLIYDNDGYCNHTDIICKECYYYNDNTNICMNVGNATLDYKYLIRLQNTKFDHILNNTKKE